MICADAGPSPSCRLLPTNKASCTSVRSIFHRACSTSIICMMQCPARCTQALQTKRSTAQTYNLCESYLVCAHQPVHCVNRCSVPEAALEPRPVGKVSTPAVRPLKHLQRHSKHKCGHSSPQPRDCYTCNFGVARLCGQRSPVCSTSRADHMHLLRQKAAYTVTAKQQAAQ